MAMVDTSMISGTNVLMQFEDGSYGYVSQGMTFGEIVIIIILLASLGLRIWELWMQYRQH